jgi:glutathione S-transferase
MSLTLHYHPLSSFCMKALVALYETGAPFTPHLVDLSDPAQRAALTKLSALSKFPVLCDDATGEVIPESTIIIEYLAHRHPGNAALIPGDPDQARTARLRDRLFDLYVNAEMQTIVGDRLRPADQRDPRGVERATARLRTTYAILDDLIGAGPWAIGEAFTLADCAAAPALFYANRVAPIDAGQRNLSAYLARLVERPSFARVLAEAQPYFHKFPAQP